MVVTKDVTFNSQGDLQSQVTRLDANLAKLFQLAQGRIRFGDGGDGEFGENMSGQFQVVADSGTANTEFSVSHNLGVIPIGFLVTLINKGGVVYTSGTTWTTSTVYFKCTTANTALTVFLIK